MKPSLLLGIALTAIATGTLASPAPGSLNAPSYHQQVAASDAHRSMQNRVAQDGSERTQQNRVAENGSERSLHNRIAESDASHVAQNHV